MFDVICCQVLDRREHDEDVPVLLDDVYVFGFLLVVKRYSMHCYPLVYRVDVPNEMKIR